MSTPPSPFIRSVSLIEIILESTYRVLPRMTLSRHPVPLLQRASRSCGCLDFRGDGIDLRPRFLGPSPNWKLNLNRGNCRIFFSRRKFATELCGSPRSVAGFPVARTKTGLHGKPRGNSREEAIMKKEEGKKERMRSLSCPPRGERGSRDYEFRSRRVIIEFALQRT